MPTKLPSRTPPAAKLADLRKAVDELGSRGAGEVDAVRRAFTAGTAPLQTAGSGSAADFIGRFGGDDGVASQVVKSTAQLGLSTSVVGTIATPPRPELDYVEVSDDRTFGVLDSFYTHLVASLSINDLSKVTYLRVMRSSSGRVKGAPEPSFSAMMDSVPLTAGTKSSEHGANAAFRVAAIGVGNRLTTSVVDDPFSRQRAVVSSGNLRPLPPISNTNRRSSPAGLIAIANADRSVLENVGFFVNQRTMTPVQKLTQPLVVAQRHGINVMQGSAVGSAGTIVEVGNSSGFYEVARLPVAGARRIGAFAEVEYFDPAVVYGMSYTYYVVAVTADGTESPRSRLVKADIVRFKPPSPPDVMFNVVAGRPRFTVNCSGSFLDHVEVFRKGGVIPEAIRVLSTRRAMIDEVTPIEMKSGFYHVGDIGLGSDRSAVYVDRNVSGGQTLEYRFYTVDSFGLKSSTPFSCSILLPDDGHSIPLPLPSITAEQTSGGRSVNISVRCDDHRVSSFIIGRRELMAGENSYRQPTSPDWFNLGTPLSAKRTRQRIGPTLNEFSQKAWLGILPAVSGAASFFDLSVEFDRRYQYAVYAIDARGNQSSRVPSSPVFVSVKPVSDAPVGVSGTVLVSQNGLIPTGVMISWNAGTLDFSPNDLIGDQDVLAASAQRTVYQVERRPIGRSFWDSMPAVTGTYFVDPVSNELAPKFRPAYAAANAEYDYRVIAMQSGAFLSNYTEPVRVTITPSIPAPGMTWVRSTPSSLRPVSVVVSWQYDGDFVDGWEIERAAVNKIYASKILSMDSLEARSLDYSPVAEIMRESSRGHGISNTPLVDPKIFVGNRFYFDQDVDLVNSYFYRIRAFDATGKFSEWSYAGISLTDSLHDRKFMSALSDDEKAALSLDRRPVLSWRSR